MADKVTAKYICNACGGEVRFDVKAQKFMCAACRCEYNPQTESDAVIEKDFVVQKMLVSSDEMSGVKSAKCATCGGEVFFSDNETATRCPMCGSSQIRESAATAIVKPDGVVPFKIDAQDAQACFRKYIKKRFFAPSTLKKSFEEGALEGWYFPVWTFDSETTGKYSGEGGKHRSELKPDGKKVTVTDWYPVSGTVERNFDDVLVIASDNRSKELFSDLTDYSAKDVKPFTTQYLQGYKAEYRSIEAGEAFETACVKMKQELMKTARSQIRSEYDEERHLTLNAIFRNVTCKSLLLPLYRASYSFSGKVYAYVINGQNGEVTAKYPKSAIKIILFILGIIAGIAGIVWLLSLL